MTNQRMYRYPGVKPFTTEEQIIFRGREEDVKALIQLVTRKRLVVLFGKSGLGKSSLLNAGLIPELTEVKAGVKEGTEQAAFYYEPQSIRFGAWTEAQKDARISPVEAVKSRLSLPSAQQTYLDRMLPEDNSLWKHLKKFQALAPIQSHFLLLFDQFEELFTYPNAEIDHFHQELGEVLNAKVPQRFRSVLGQERSVLTEEEESLLFEPIDLRVVMAIRSDRLAMLDRLSEKMPDILENRYQLKALSRKEAEEAIFSPSILPQDPNFQTPGFNLEEDALDHIIRHLAMAREGSQDIESFQLQVICQHIEQELVERAGKRSIGIRDLGDLSDIFEQYYESKMARLPSEEDRQKARIFIENGLILEQDERRLSLYEGMIQRDYQVSEALLFQLVGTGLLRSEPDPKGGFSYELAHDTLVEPILRAKRKRVGEEEKRQLALQAEQERALAQLELAETKRKTRRRIFGILIGAAALAVVMLTFAWQQSKNAEMEKLNAEILRQRAEEQRQLAERQRQLKEDADSLRQLSDELYQQTLEALKETDAAKAEAILREQQALVAESIANSAKVETAQRLAELEAANLSRVQSKLAQFQELVMKLEYEEATKLVKEAVDLGVGKEQVKPAISELLFVYTQLHETEKAWEILGLTGARVQDFSSTQDSLAFLEDQYEDLVSAETARFLQHRYFPSMIDIPGGSFMMGADTAALREKNLLWGDDELPAHRVSIDEFQMGKSEVTVHQYLMYAGLEGISNTFRGGWEVMGHTPVIRVSWYDAIEFCNWMSKNSGLDTVYASESGDFVDERIIITQQANGFRLPTEAEWEYAATAGGRDKVFAGGHDLEKVGWYGINSDRPMPVMTKYPNAFGLYDMSGNVWEWCQDRYGAYPEESDPNPTGPESGGYRVLRGGSWSNYDGDCRVSDRGYNYPYNRDFDVGFRLTRN